LQIAYVEKIHPVFRCVRVNLADSPNVDQISVEEVVFEARASLQAMAEVEVEKKRTIVEAILKKQKSASTATGFPTHWPVGNGVVRFLTQRNIANLA